MYRTGHAVLHTRRPAREARGGPPVGEGKRSGNRRSIESERFPVWVAGAPVARDGAMQRFRMLTLSRVSGGPEITNAPSAGIRIARPRGRCQDRESGARVGSTRRDFGRSAPPFAGPASLSGRAGPIRVESL
jgi:hypothetical protein